MSLEGTPVGAPLPPTWISAQSETEVKSDWLAEVSQRCLGKIMAVLIRFSQYTQPKHPSFHKLSSQHVILLLKQIQSQSIFILFIFIHFISVRSNLYLCLTHTIIMQLVKTDLMQQTDRTPAHKLKINPPLILCIVCVAAEWFNTQNTLGSRMCWFVELAAVEVLQNDSQRLEL